MDSSSPSTSACPQEADKQCPIQQPIAVDEGPTQEPLPLPPPVLNDYPDVLHAWKMVNWVYQLRAKAVSKKARKRVVSQSAGYLMLGLFIIWNTASEECDKLSSLGALSPSGPNPERSPWAFVLDQVQRRQAWIEQREPATVAAIENYDSPAMLTMSRDSSRYAMRLMREKDETTGSLPTYDVKVLEALIDSWKLLAIGRELLQDDTRAEIVTAKECTGAIKKLQERIEVTKWGLP